MKVRRLEIASFRGFKNLVLDFSGPVTALVGINGAGKTSILDCLAVLLSQVSSGVLSRTGHGRRFRESDIHRDEPATFNTVEVRFGDTVARWSLALVRRGLPREVSSDLGGLKPVIARIQEENAQSRYQLPLAVYYPINRAPVIPARIRTHHDFGPLSAYDEALVGGGWNFRLFFEWFREREDIENEERLKKGLTHRDPQLQAVRKGIEQLVPGFTGLRVQRFPQRMIVKKEGVDFEVDQLSEGEKNLLALAGDLARRLALANPLLPDPLLAEAVVMIDEIELHLHPGWQRMVVEALQRTFPGCQFILTTHSPQVLSQVPTESVILLDRFQRKQLAAGTWGRDSYSILTEVMGDTGMPLFTVQRVQEISRLIDEEKLPEARHALDDLAQRIGAHDSEIVRLRALINFLGG